MGKFFLPLARYARRSPSDLRMSGEANSTGHGPSETKCTRQHSSTVVVAAAIVVYLCRWGGKPCSLCQHKSRSMHLFCPTIIPGSALLIIIDLGPHPSCVILIYVHTWDRSYHFRSTYVDHLRVRSSAWSVMADLLCVKYVFMYPC